LRFTRHHLACDHNSQTAGLSGGLTPTLQPEAALP
jgi:hypothetical protein